MTTVHHAKLVDVPSEVSTEANTKSSAGLRLALSTEVGTARDSFQLLEISDYANVGWR